MVPAESNPLLAKMRPLQTKVLAQGRGSAGPERKSKGTDYGERDAERIAP